MLKHSETNSKVNIVVDCDVDGYASGAITYLALKSIGFTNITYLLHDGKRHGLSEDIHIDDDAKLVIIPDAGTNDIEACKKLHNKGIDVICLDHHVIEEPNPYAVILNCKSEEVPEQGMCGAAVTWMFFSQFDECNMDKYLDLVALATVADNMDVCEPYNMFFIQQGLENVSSKLLIEFFNKLTIDLTNVTIKNIQFGVAPLINALIRMGRQEEKQLLFEAFIQQYKEFEYKKRGAEESTTENIYERMYRLCANAKSRQRTAREKAIALAENNINNDLPIVVGILPDGVEPTLTGLVAMQVADKYNKPCVILRKNDIPNCDASYYTGSIRNCNGSPITDLKTFLSDLNCFESILGHDNASGVKIKNENVALLKDTLKSLDIEIGDKQFTVDFEIDSEEIDINFISSMTFFDRYSGNGFNNVSAVVHGIVVSKDNVSVMGKNKNCWKVAGSNGVSYVDFKTDEDDELIRKYGDEMFAEEDAAEIDAVCEFGLNNYNGMLTPQCIILGYEIVREVSAEEIAGMIADEDDFEI